MRKIKFLPLILIMFLTFTTLSMAESEDTINNDANEALQKFYQEVKGSQRYLMSSKAYLIFPDIKEAGFFVGGKYGEGVLRVGTTSKAYFSIAAASVGMQMGMQKYSLVIAFRSDAALNNFLLNDDEWETDVDGQIAMAEWNSEEELDSIDFGTSMVGFVFNSTGIMGSLTMEGTKFKRIQPD